MNKPTVFDCTVIGLNKHYDERGSLTVVENDISLPFSVQRVFYLYDIPSEESRGAHAHKNCHQFLIAASGAFEVILDDSKVKRTIQLTRPYYGVHIPPGIWAYEQAFSSNSICLVLASEKYDEADYIRNYEEFLEWIR
jgi:dTDP-4-dehydrorhamnose 3,5-epimerase-like enzyme